MEVDVYVCEQAPACSNAVHRQIAVRSGHGFRLGLHCHCEWAGRSRAQLEVECVLWPN